ncbi:MAG: hypothetical protein NVS9B3_15820 [Gemmatimonadaceae bacterium]
MSVRAPIALGALYGPVTTPFSSRTGEVDLDALEGNLRAHLAAGINGIVLAGSTGEAALDEVGLAGGDVRPPLLPLGTGDRARVRELLAVAKRSEGGVIAGCTAR